MSAHESDNYSCTLPPGHAGPCKPGRCPWHGFWGWCGNSWSIAWGYLQVVVGTALDVLNALTAMPEFTDLVTSYGGPYASHIIKGFGVVTILCRLRTLKA